MKKFYLLGVLLLWATHSFCAVIYVKPNGTGNGTSWALAYGSLTTALQNAQTGDEIWVAQGTYKPSNTLNSTASFVFKNGVKVYGGFAGTETTLTARADTTGTTTILSGELSSTVRSNTILKIDNAASTLNLLDGFTLQGAQWTITSPTYGGGAVQAISSTIEFRNVTVRDNSITLITNDPNASGYSGGAGIFGYQSNITLNNVDIINNSYDVQSTLENAQVLHGGAGIMMHQGTLNYIKGKVQANEISAQSLIASGGGAYLLWVNDVYMQDVWVLENIDNAENGHGAGLYLAGCEGTRIIQCVFNYNFSNSDGDALTLQGGDAEVTNVTFSVHGGSVITSVVYAEGAEVVFNNTVFQGQVTANYLNDITYNNCVSTYGFGIGDINNSVNADMQFTDPRQNLFTPSSCSQQLNIGNNSFISLPYDINGNPRVVGSAVDPGAVELQHTWTNNRVYVDAASTNSFRDGATWESAFTTIEEALKCGCDHEGVIIQPAEIWVAHGTYRPYISNELEHSKMKLNNNQKIYGGFTPGATSLDERDIDFDTNQTIITGHIEGDFYVYNAMFAYLTDTTCEVNGFIFENCNASHPNAILEASGAAIQVRDGQITLKNIWARNNQGVWGGPIAFDDSGAIMDNIKLTGNNTLYNGAGLYFFDGELANPPSVITNLEISNNSAGSSGGAIYIDDDYNITIDNFTITDNTAGSGGGAISINSAAVTLSRGVIDGHSAGQNGGAISISAPPGDPAHVNIESVLITNSSGNAGGALYMSHSLLNITNCTFAGNHATWNGNVFGFFGGTVNVKNSIIDNPDNEFDIVSVHPPSQATNSMYNISNTMVNDGFTPIFTMADDMILNTDPQFIDPENGNYNLTPCGPGVDMGINSLLALNPAFDAVGNPRIKNQIVDLGALEFQYLDIDILQQPEDVLTAAGQQVQFTVEANLEGLDYQWQVSTDGGTTWANIPNATAETLTVNPVTVSMHQNLYRCILSDCTNAGLSETAILAISGMAGLEEFNHAGLKVFPNPATEQFTLQHEGALAGGDVIIYDVQGRVIFQQALTADMLQRGIAINSTAWSSGVYWVHVKNEQQTVVKFIKD